MLRRCAARVEKRFSAVMRRGSGVERRIIPVRPCRALLRRRQRGAMASFALALRAGLAAAAGACTEQAFHGPARQSRSCPRTRCSKTGTRPTACRLSTPSAPSISCRRCKWRCRPTAPSWMPSRPRPSRPASTTPSPPSTAARGSWGASSRCSTTSPRRRPRPSCRRCSARWRRRCRRTTARCSCTPGCSSASMRCMRSATPWA